MFDSVSASPSEIVAEVLRLLEAEDYTAAAELYHPDYVASAVTTSWRDARPEQRHPTVEGLLKLYPDMPREAAEYQVKQAKNCPPRPPYFEELYGVESESDLEALTPIEVLARRLWGSDYRWRFREYLDGLTEKHPEYEDQLQEQRARLTYMWKGVPLGHVERGDRAYVVVGSPDGAPDDYPEGLPDDYLARLVVVRMSAAGWRISSDLGSKGGAMVHLHVAVKNADGETVVLS